MTSYVTNSEANTYFHDQRYNSGLWDQTSEADKTKLLLEATQLIENLNFSGDKADEDQELEFPRGDSDDVPEDIKIACYEIAYAILSGRDVEYEAQLIGQSTASTSVGRLVVDPDTINLAKIHLIPSVKAWLKLRPYLRNGSVITLTRLD